MSRPLVAVALALGLLAASCAPDIGALRATDTSDDAGVDGGASAGDGGLLPDGAPLPVNFGRDIRPLMNRPDTEPYGCKRCHYRTGDDPQGIELGGLDMTTLGDLRKGGVSSKSNIVIAGDPDNSAIVQKLEGTYSRGSRMPKSRTPWSVAEIGLVRRWIAEGAKGADGE